MLDAAAPLSAARPQPVATPVAARLHLSFHEVLSELNPLQYLPVIGTIYRAITGDQIPETVRRIGSLVVSGLLGGPIGVVINVAVMVAEKITGINLDRTGQVLLAGNGYAGHPATNAAPASGPRPAPVAQAETRAASAFSPVQAWSPAQLAAYGVSTTPDGVLKLADRSGADVLNALELLRIQGARAAYERAANLTS